MTYPDKLQYRYRYMTKENVEFLHSLVMSLLNESKSSEQFLEMVVMFNEFCGIGVDEIKKFKTEHGRLPDEKVQ